MDIAKSIYYSKLSGDVKNRYNDKIRNCDGIDPYTLKANELSIDPKDFPNITVLDIGNYMIRSINPFTRTSNNAYKSTEAYRYFESGFVLNIGSKRINSSVIVTGKVKHSQRMNEAPLQAWVLASMDGKISCAHCTCIAGLSETCSHVGAICYAVSSIGESVEIKSVTEMLCKWNVPNFKEASMSAATNIGWRIRSQELEPITAESSFRLYCDSVTHFTDERVDQFIQKCNAVNDDTALETILAPATIRRTNIRDEVFLASIYCENNQSKSLSELVEIGKSMSLYISNDEVKEIFRLTLPSVKSKCCVGLRRGRITGSNFKSCSIANVSEPSITTINRLINPKKLDNVPSIRYQNKNKKKAVDQYIKMIAPNHDDFVYRKCGILINQKLPYFAGSPDGLVYCDCHGDGCIVVKCLKVLSSGASIEVLTTKPNNILNKHRNEYYLEESHEFFYQVQLQINLIELEYCDFIIWSPKEVLPLRVYPDVEFWNTTMEKARRFHEQVMMPELLGKFYTRKTDIPNSMNEEDMSGDDVELVALEIELLS